MALHVITSNRVERLQQSLSSLLQAEPLHHPLMAETVLIPSMPMQRWLGLQLAESAGIHCNVDYALPASWIWRLVSGEGSANAKPDPLARDSAAWLMFGLLPHLLHQPQFSSLQRYLNNDPEGVKRWQLCSRIADVFDRYQYYRSDMIRNWSDGNGEGWQPILWRALLNSVGSNSHRVALVDHWLAHRTTTVPPRVVLFCIAALPPLLLDLLQHVAEKSEVYLYHLIPTNHYWADLKTEKSQAKRPLEHSETGHALLASWGRQGQAYQEMLLDHGGLEGVEDGQCHQDWPATRLGNLQRDIFALQPDLPEAIADDSLEIHICHSAQRECQVLHDALLQRLEDHPSLKPEDILIMVPEISRYAPYITTVFANNDHDRPFIPWNISEIAIADDHPLVAAFLQLLRLPSSRFAYSEVMSLLDLPEVCIRFSLDNGAVVAVRNLLERLHVCWGVDADHRQQLGLPASIANSWKQAEQRFLAGYAMGEEEVWQGIAPLAVDDGSTGAMAHFWLLFERLNYWRQQLQQPRSAHVWQVDLTNMVDDFFSAHGDDGVRVQQIRDQLADLAQQAGENELSITLVTDWLQHQLSQQDVANHYFSGGVSFCGMRPMRSLPFRVICLLGMQDAAFPRRDHPVEFDLMAEQWQPGDPRKGEADRYLMLETLLCARDTLYISYTGRSIRDNSECQPSVVVGELRDELIRCYGEEAVHQITYHHPMQPFSAVNFTSGGSHDHYWCRLANAVAGATSVNERGWPKSGLNVGRLPEDISPNRLIQFTKHPVKFFVNHTLNIYLNQHNVACDDEPFTLDGLQCWQLRERLLQLALQQDEDADMRLKAEGVLPHGLLADQALKGANEKIAPLQAALHEVGELMPQPQSVDITCGTEPMRICGQLQDYYLGIGILHLSPSYVVGKHLLTTWITHLTLCASNGLHEGEVSRLVGVDRTVSFDPLSEQEALQQLTALMDGYRQGVERPLPIFPAASWAYASSMNQSQDRSKATKAALGEWQDSYHQRGDFYDPYISLMMRQVDSNPIDDSDFMAWAQRLYTPLLQAAAP